MSAAAAKVLLDGIRDRSNDVIGVLDRLYRKRQITMRHVRALRQGAAGSASGDDVTYIEGAARIADHTLRCKGLLPWQEAAR